MSWRQLVEKFIIIIRKNDISTNMLFVKKFFVPGSGVDSTRPVERRVLWRRGPMSGTASRRAPCLPHDSRCQRANGEELSSVFPLLAGPDVLRADKAQSRQRACKGLEGAVPVHGVRRIASALLRRFKKMGRSRISIVTSTPMCASCVLMMVAMVGSEGAALWVMMVYLRGLRASTPASFSRALAFWGW